MSIRNTELLEVVMQHIEDHPDKHDQGDYVRDCGTVACFAGWACLLSGWQYVSTYPARVGDGKHEKSIPALAIELLGLTEDESEILFDDNNTRPALRLMVKDLVNGDHLRDLDQYVAETDSGVSEL